MKKVVGTKSIHILCELYNCNHKILDDVELIEKYMVEAALEAGAEIRQVAFQKFAPCGVSGVVIISESHLTIHSWPEEGYASIDVYTCGDKINPMDACIYLKDKLEAKTIFEKQFIRGDGEIREKE